MLPQEKDELCISKLQLSEFRSGGMWREKPADSTIQSCSIWVEATRRARWLGSMCNLLARLGDIDAARRKALQGLQLLGGPMPQAVAHQPSDLARKVSWLAVTCLNPLCKSPPEASSNRNALNDSWHWPLRHLAAILDQQAL